MKHIDAITENRRLRIKNFDDQTLLSIAYVGVKSSDVLLKRFKDDLGSQKLRHEELREVVSDSIAEEYIHISMVIFRLFCTKQ